MSKIAQEIAALSTAAGAQDAAEHAVIAKDQLWAGGEGYTIYTFDDNSQLIVNGVELYALDADDAASIIGYSMWLNGEACAAQTNDIERMLEALTDHDEPHPAHGAP